jgi:hypothetical protein
MNIDIVQKNHHESKNEILKKFENLKTFETLGISEGYSGRSPINKRPIIIKITIK